ncbi:hypothetical protein NCS57_00475600 [Fusarium keratoplasticum]|uniref:Uncharacterized protein n=1 Tax=Fusarium keratoplasticum TaxID=1328300 RepID=A0ACC0R931_9HYPO|nr:hypothetical protein NCS57_00475600 [Fusarium keratoplasticum]KAI8675736.1 hypothetical protein NCS57_00475600 [Fusarium keratoplasticum]
MTAAEALKAVDLAPNLEFTSSRNDSAIYYTQRTDGSEDVFFANNGLREQVDVLLSLRGQGYPKILNPTTGETVGFVISSRSGPRTNLAYNFNPPESIVVVMRRKARKSLHSVSKDEHQLLAATPFESFVATPHQNISSSFAVTLWAKPEVAQFGTSNYIIYPTSSYGDGHASMSLSLGTNGIQIGEATTSSPKTVIGLNETANNFAVSGWTHFAIVYENDTLSLYVNGEMISKGTKSSNIVHPGLGQPDAPARMPKRFDGDLAGLEVHAEPLKAAEIKALFEQGLPQPNSPSPIELRGSDKALFRRGGNTLVSLNGSWEVSFPADRLPKKRGSLTIELPQLKSLKDHEDFDVAHFSGTATYKTKFQLPKDHGTKTSKGAKTCVLLNLGRVENIASVKQNFAIEEWPDWFAKGLEGRGYNNGDEFGNDGTRKPGERVTFTSWKHYDESSPLFESGLLGPVTVTVAELVDVKV